MLYKSIALPIELRRHKKPIITEKTPLRQSPGRLFATKPTNITSDHLLRQIEGVNFDAFSITKMQTLVIQKFFDYNYIIT